MTNYDYQEEKYSLNSEEDEPNQVFSSVISNEYKINDDEMESLTGKGQVEKDEGTGNVFLSSFTLIQTCVGAGNIFIKNRNACHTIYIQVLRFR
jgi:hypothetical protein